MALLFAMVSEQECQFRRFIHISIQVCFLENTWLAKGIYQGEQTFLIAQDDEG